MQAASTTAEAGRGAVQESDTLYLVGDIVDGWQLRRHWYWPQAHNDVVQKLLRKARKGTRVLFVPGNHDEFARKYVAHNFGSVGGGGLRPRHGRWPQAVGHARRPARRRGAAMACGTPVAAFPVPDPLDVVAGSAGGALDEDLQRAAMRALELPRESVRQRAPRFDRER